MELQLIGASLQSRHDYELIKSYIDVKLSTYSKHFQIIMGYIGDYYSRDGDINHIQLEVLQAQIAEGLRNPKHVDMFNELLAEAAGAAVSGTNVRAVVLAAKQQEVADRLSAALVSMSGGGQVDDLMDELRRLRSMTSLEELMEEGLEVYSNVDLSALMHHEYDPDSLIKVYPESLNDRIDGGAKRGHHITIFGRPECYAEGTEILTKTGWLNFSALTMRHEVAQVLEDRSIEYVIPSRVMSYDVDEDLIYVSNKKKQVELLVTKEHDLVTEVEGSLVKTPANSVVYRQNVKHHTSALLKRGEEELSYLHKFYIAFQADGSFGNKNVNGRYSGTIGVNFSLFKQRKVDRLKGILESLSWNYTCNKDKAGKIIFYVKVPVELMPDKSFDWLIPSQTSLLYRQQFIEELSYWDSTRRTNNRIKFDTTTREVANKVQEVCALSNINCFLSIAEDTRKESYKDVFRLSIRTNYQPSDGQHIIKKYVKYKGDVYCCSVPSGMILVRYNGKVSISGNSMKTGLSINANCGFARQGFKSIYFINEDRPQDIILRHVSNLSGMTKAEIRDNPTRAQDKARYNGFDNIMIISCSPGTPSQIEEYLERHSPDVVIIDQLRNLKVKADNRVNQLEYAATTARTFGKKHNCLMWSVTQAGDSGSNKPVLEMGDIDNSNTGIPAQADLLIGVGVDPRMEEEGIRMISLPKNKISGTHEHFPVKVIPQLSRVKSV